MFYYIEGVVSLIDGSVAVVDCGGVGYAVNTTVNSLSRVRIGEKARFYTCTIIREDCFDIYGFATAEEKRCFELLIGVSGVGAKAAQAILSANTPESLSCYYVRQREGADGSPRYREKDRAARDHGAERQILRRRRRGRLF